MAFDDKTRNRLQKLVSDSRSLLADEFRIQAQQTYGLDPNSGEVTPLERLGHLNDREIRIDNGWVIKIGRRLDFFQKPDSWLGIGANDLSLRRCLETKVDIFRS